MGTINVNKILFKHGFLEWRVSIDRVSWFLCILALTYFFFPWINKHMERKYTNFDAIKMVIFSLFIMGIIGVIADNCSGNICCCI